MTATATAPWAAEGEAPVVRHAAAAFAVAMSAALALAIVAPLPVAVIGLAVFGLPHTALETRYVVGRFSPRYGPRSLLLWLAPITVVVGARLLQTGPAKQVEVVVAAGLAAAAWVWATRRQALLMVVGVAVLAVAAFASLAALAWFVVVVAFLHNLTPVPFLWEWAGPRRWGFKTIHLVWAVGIPLLLLAGVFDPLLRHAAGWALPGAGTTADVAALYTPPPLLSGVWPLRFLAAFAYLQTMHYFVWCGFVPAASGTEAAAARELGPLRPLWRRRWFAALVTAAAVATTLLFALDYATGRWLYGAVASYHAYVEFPVLAVLAATALGAGPTRERPDPERPDPERPDRERPDPEKSHRNEQEKR